MILILIVFAFVCFSLAAYISGKNSIPVTLIALGLAFWMLTNILPAAR